MAARPSSTLAFARPLVLALAVSAFGCGGAKQSVPEPSAPETPPPAAAPAPAPTAEAPPAPAPEAAPSEPEPEKEPPREVKYIKTPEGLRVQILGVNFEPKAEAVRTQLGFIVKVTLSATASEARTLLAPKHGALAFAGSVKRKGVAEPETFGDERSGDGEQPLGAGTSVKLTREWPGDSKVRPLGNGDVLELDVGLWGLGTTASDRRAVKQFLRVKAKVEAWKGRAWVDLPPNLKGK